MVCVERTLLSAAVDVALVVHCFKIKIKIKIKINTKIKGSGQECPLHTCNCYSFFSPGAFIHV